MDTDNYISNVRHDIKAFLEKRIPNNWEHQKAANYSLLAPSHLWRPVLSCAFAHEYGTYPDIIPLSCAAELYHTAGLIFDDLPSMDDSHLRRGQSTCHIKYNESTAMLATLYLMQEASNIIIDYAPSHKVIDLIKEGTNVVKRMIYGQELDLSRDAPSEYEHILPGYRHKTGDLFAFSTKIGLLGRNGLFNDEEIEEFGHNLGVTYQISDDLSDVLATTKTMGKDTHMDVNKSNSIYFLGVKDAKKEAQRYKEKAMRFIKGKKLLEELVDRIIVIPDNLETLGGTK